jgi:hypothetical protein
MAENEDVKPATPAADIPDLKKKEKERKKAGFAWGAKAGKSPWQGATGGAGAKVAARVATEVAKPLIQRVLATVVGKVAATVIVAGVIAAAGTAILGPTDKAGKTDVVLGDIASNINTKREGRSGLNFTRGGGLAQPVEKAGDTEKVAGPDAEERGEETEKADETMIGDQMGRDGGVTDLMENNMKGAKLSTEMGGGKFGGKSVFANSTMPKFGAGFDRNKLKALSVSPKNGKGGTLAKRTNNSSRNIRFRGVRRNKALGQLKGAASLNAKVLAGGSEATEANAAAADTQFSGTEINGATAPSGPGDINPGANGDTGDNYAPDDFPECEGRTYPVQDSSGNWSCKAFDIPGIDASPWKHVLNSAWDMIDQAVMLLMISSIIYGFLYGAACGWWATGCCSWVGWIIMAIALGLAIYFQTMVHKLAKELIGMGDKINELKGEPIGDRLKKIGDHLKTGAWLAITSVGGIAMGIYVIDERNDLKDKADKKLKEDQAEADREQAELEAELDGAGSTGTGTSGESNGSSGDSGTTDDTERPEYNDGEIPR